MLFDNAKTVRDVIGIPASLKTMKEDGNLSWRKMFAFAKGSHVLLKSKADGV